MFYIQVKYMNIYTDFIFHFYWHILISFLSYYCTVSLYEFNCIQFCLTDVSVSINHHIKFKENLLSYVFLHSFSAYSFFWSSSFFFSFFLSYFLSFFRSIYHSFLLSFFRSFFLSIILSFLLSFFLPFMFISFLPLFPSFTLLFFPLFCSFCNIGSSLRNLKV